MRVWSVGDAVKRFVFAHSITVTALKPLSRICFITLNDRVGSRQVTGSKVTGSGRVTGQIS